MRKLAMLVCAAVLLASGQAAAESLVLRQGAVVNDNVIRLGDLFENAGAKGDVVVAPAPALGRRAVYDARWLQAMARASSLAWNPASRYDHIIVERASQTIQTSEIMDILKAAIAEKKNGEAFEIELDNRNLEIFAPADSEAALRVRNLSINESSGRFTAKLVLGGGKVATKSLRASGRIYRIARIPVLNRQIKPGTVISEEDIDWVTQRADTLQHTTLASTSQIVGLTPRRWSRPGEPLRAGDLRKPIVIAKGTTVVMVLKTTNMTITVRGRAVENGSKGDVIRVMNTQSRRVVGATVTGPGTVMVSPLGGSAATTHHAWVR